MTNRGVRSFSRFADNERYMLQVVTSFTETIICVSGECAAQSAETFEALFDAASRADDWAFAIDLTRCTYVDCEALSAFVQLWRRYRDRFKVRIRPKGFVHTVFGVCGFLSREIFVTIVPGGDAA